MAKCRSGGLLQPPARLVEDREAKQLQEDRPIELWSNDRLVKRLSAPVAKHRNTVSHEIHEGRMIPKKT
jgi:hypothetical protein